MKVFCTDTFRREYHKLIKKNSYRSLGKLIIEEVLQQPSANLATSTVLNGRPTDIPFYKKRIGGSSGFRLYCILVIKDDKLYFLYVHPKTGSKGIPNIKQAYHQTLQEELVTAIEQKQLFVVNRNGNQLNLTPYQEEEE